MKKSLKMKALVIACIMCFITIFWANIIFADENESSNKEKTGQINSIIDVKNVNGEYKLSEDKNELYLPFLINAIGRIEIDKQINKLGIISSASTIEVNDEMKNIQVLFSQDTVRVNADIEYGIVFATKDVVINSEINKNAVIFASDTVTIAENATVNDDVIIFANTVNIKGRVNSSAIIIAPNINVTGKIKNDLRCNTSNLNIENEECVEGNLYVNTTNKEMNIKEMFKDATVNIIKENTKSNSIGKIILNTITSCLMFTLLYLIVKKISKSKAYEVMLVKVKSNTLFVVLSSAIFLLAFPVVFMLLILLSILGLYILALPILIIYTALLLLCAILAIFIVGSTIFEYINKKYTKADKLYIELVGAFFTYVSLTLISKIPAVGFYAYMAMVMFASGIILACILKKEKNN